MSKCGKGCMPECEYFTTGGCISPFNCMYKEESGYIISATSGKVFYTEGLGVSNTPIDDSVSIYEVANALQAEVEKLKAENAELRATLSKMETVEKELRARLETAVELPFAVIDKKTGKVADVCNIALKEEWAKHLIYCDIDSFAIKEDGTLILIDDCNNIAYCPYDRFKIKAEAQFAELKGEKK